MVYPERDKTCTAETPCFLWELIIRDSVPLRLQAVLFHAKTLRMSSVSLALAVWLVHRNMLRPHVFPVLYVPLPRSRGSFPLLLARRPPSGVEEGSTVVLEYACTEFPRYSTENRRSENVGGTTTCATAVFNNDTHRSNP